MSRGHEVADRVRVLLAGRSLRGVLTLVTGATAAQALLFAARPVLTRLYTPEAFGLLGVFVAPAYLLAMVSTFRYDDAIAVPDEPRDGAGVFGLAVAAAAATGLFLTLALPFRQAAAAALGTPELAPLLVLVPPTAAFLGIAAASRTWLARAERYRAMSGVVMAQAVVVVAIQVGTYRAGAWGLVLATALGAVVLGVGGVLLAARAGAVAQARQADLGALARRFRRFPLYGLPATGLTQLSTRLPPLVLVGAFGPAVVGYFSVAVASVAVPVALVTDAVGQVFYVRAAAAQREARLGPLVEFLFARLAAFAAFPVLAVALLGPDLFAVVFSETWRTAGEYARLLAPWLLLAAIAPPLTRVFDVTERQRSEFAVGAWTAVLVGAGLAVGAWWGEVEPALVALAAGGTAARVVQLGWIAHVAQASGARMIVDLVRSLVVASLALVPAALALMWGGLWVALAGTVAGGLAYAAWAVPSPNE